MHVGLGDSTVPRILLLVVVAILLEIASPFGPARTDAGPQPQPSELSGTVLNHFGKPAQFALVLALNDDSCPSGCGLSSTDTNGHWESTIEPGTYIFQASGSSPGDAYFEGNAFWTSHGSTTDKSEAEEVVITSGQNITLDFTLPGSGGLTWQITDSSGEPISYPEIVIDGTCACNLVPLTGGQFGTYSHELATGHYTVSAASPGYVTTYWTASGGTSDPALAEGVRICPSRQTVIGIRLHASAPAGGATPIPVPPPTSPGCPVPFAFQQSTVASAGADVGTSQLSVSESSFVTIGDWVLIGGDTVQAEVAEVETRNSGTPAAQPQGHASPGYLTLVNPLVFSHSAGERVDEVFNGDINCDGARNLSDAISLLAGLQGARRVPAGCPGVNETNSLGKAFGDVDCDGDVGELDALYYLAWWVDLPAEVPVRCLDL